MVHVEGGVVLEGLEDDQGADLSQGEQMRP